MVCKVGQRSMTGVCSDGKQLFAMVQRLDNVPHSTLPHHVQVREIF